jgi:hypothetical protein
MDITAITALTADDILRVNARSIHTIVDYDTHAYQFKKLRSIWHPDRNNDPLAGDVMRHLNMLVIEAEQQVADGTWHGHARITFTAKSTGTFYSFKYIMCEPFELGTTYISSNYVAYVFDSANADLAKDGVAMLNSITYPKAVMETEFKPSFPEVEGSYDADIGYVVVLKKQPSTVRLHELVAHQGGAIDPKHVAWMVSCMINITTFLDFVGITHNSILPSTIFVDVERHSCMLVGGWWYSARTDTKLKAMPSIVANSLPSAIMKSKIADTKVDRQSVKRTMLYALGDPTMSGSRLYANTDIPKPMLGWLRSPCSDTAIKDYQSWDNQLNLSFGKRKFIKFDSDISSIQ